MLFILFITLDPTEVSTHESSNRPNLESRGLFEDFRNSMSMENEEYQQLKKNMNKEIQESPTYSFGNRK